MTGHQSNSRREQMCLAPQGEPLPPDGMKGDPVLFVRVLDVPPEAIADLPEGEVITIANPALAPPTNGGGATRGVTIAPSLAGGAQGTATGLNSYLKTFGFTGKVPGGNTIGIVGYPRWFTQGSRGGVPTGHTATFARVGGRIVAARGFVPESGLRMALNLRGVTAGSMALPGIVQNDLAIFLNMGARAVEWPVPAAEAIAFAKNLPTANVPPPRGPTLYTGRPAVHPMSPQVANCVSWACTQIEAALAGRVGTVGPNGQVML